MKHFIFKEDAKKRIKKHQVELIIVDIIIIPVLVSMGIGANGGIGFYISAFLLLCVLLGNFVTWKYTVKALRNIKTEEKWFIEINDKEVIWKAPASLQLENSFTVLLSDISHVIDEVANSNDDDLESHRYKIALNNSDTIMLSQYSGIPIMQFIKALHELNIPMKIINV